MIVGHCMFRNHFFFFFHFSFIKTPGPAKLPTNACAEGHWCQMNPHFIFNALNSVNHFIAPRIKSSEPVFSLILALMRIRPGGRHKKTYSLQKGADILSLIEIGTLTGSR